MFTGIVEAQGRVTALEMQADRTAALTVSAPADLVGDLPLGGSLAVSGVCLTAAAPVAVHGDAALFVAVAMGETLDRTNLGDLRVGSGVNLERCTKAGDRLDGHIVQGHVDAVGTVIKVVDEGSWRRLRVSVPSALAEQTAEKGSVALDGVSLTITAVSAPDAAEHWLDVALIPETLAVTTLGTAVEGTRLNLETDVIAKYTARMHAVRSAKG